MSIYDYFQHLTLSPGQETALKKLDAFLDSPVDVFMLKGYAGSGKTTILKGLVEYLGSIERDFTLMAPTGRAAKVIREITGQEAYTIHKSIYSYEDLVEVEEGESFFYYYKIRNNDDVPGKIFIVDEASMLSDAKSEGEFFRFGTGHLLTDLMTYIRISHENAGTKIIFVGDPCQLPPVGDNSSKAFDPTYLKEKFNVSVEETKMVEMKRQGRESGILIAAEKIRKSVSASFFNDFNLRPNGTDIFNPPYEDFLNTWQNVMGTKIIIAWKNKTCLDLNLQIRERRFGKSNLILQKGDIIIMGGNNYSKGVFNGEFAVVNEVADVPRIETVRFYGKDSILPQSKKPVIKEVALRWRHVQLVIPDSDSTNKIVTGNILENFLYGENYLTPDEMQALYVDFKNRNKSLKPKTEEFKEAIRKDDYFNCLLIKYGYAVTCHKAQGGEWDNVFSVWDYGNKDILNCFTERQGKQAKNNEGFYRWAYTAVTRASKYMYALNPPFFNSYSSMSFLDPATVISLDELTGNLIQTEEISIDKEMLQQLNQFNLLQLPVQLQDHFIKVRQAVRKHYIEIVGWEKKNLEVFYYFERTSHTAAVKTWVNKNSEFNGKYVKLPSHTNSEELHGIIQSLLKNLPNISIRRNTSDTIISKIEFDIETEERFPFTKCLFDDISGLIQESGIFIDDLEHLQYKERYTFRRNTELAVIDFEYKINGFFGRVVPIQNKTNSFALVSDIQNVLLTFKQEEYAH